MGLFKLKLFGNLKLEIISSIAVATFHVLGVCVAGSWLCVGQQRLPNISMSAESAVLEGDALPLSRAPGWQFINSPDLLGAPALCQAVQ